MLHKALVAAREHDLGVFEKDRKGMSMDTEEQGIAPPETNDTNFIWIDANKKERHCAAVSKRASGDILWINTGMTWYGEGCRAEETCEYGGQNLTSAS